MINLMKNVILVWLRCGLLDEYGDDDTWAVILDSFLNNDTVDKKKLAND